MQIPGRLLLALALVALAGTCASLDDRIVEEQLPLEANELQSVDTQEHAEFGRPARKLLERSQGPNKPLPVGLSQVHLFQRMQSGRIATDLQFLSGCS